MIAIGIVMAMMIIRMMFELAGVEGDYSLSYSLSAVLLVGEFMMLLID